MLSPTRLGEWDTARRVGDGPGSESGTRLEGRHGPARRAEGASRSRRSRATAALSDLAVALEGPPEPLAELGTAHPQGDLAGEHQPLVVAQQRRELGHLV